MKPHRVVLSAWTTVVLLLMMGAAGARTPAGIAFDEWLAAFNSNDGAAMSRFNEKRFGDAGHNLEYLLDSREETGGLTLVRVEHSDATTFVALAKENNFPAYRRVTLQLQKPGSPLLEEVTQDPVRMAQADALKAFDAFAARLAATDRFSGVLVVEQDGKRLYGRHFGLADREDQTPVQLDTPFLFASQGKMFTAVSVLQLIEAGKVGFDDPIGKHLVDYPNREMAKVTIRQLLSHQGGAGDMGVLQPEEGANRAWVRSIGDLIKLNGDRPPGFPPGSRFEYSNYGFVLLGALVEKVSGQSYYDYLAEHVFGPAGMTATGYPTAEQMVNVARGYTQDESSALKPSADQLPWRGTPAGGGVSTADDEVRFVEALKAGKLIPLPLLMEATRQQTDWYGYGFISSGPAEFPHWGHGGGAPGNSTALSVYPSNNMTMVCLSNRDPPVCDRLLTSLHYHLAPARPAPAGKDASKPME